MMTNEELLLLFTTNASKRPFQLSDGTIALYTKHIGYFLEYVSNKHLLEVSRKDVKQYMMSLEVSDSTYNVSLSAIRSLYKVIAYLSDDDVEVNDVTFGLIAMKNVKSEHKIPLSELEQELMLKYCKNKRDYAIVLTLLSSGLRIHELVALTLDDYNNRDENGKIHLTITKGSKEADVYFNDKVCKAIDEYLTIRKESEYNNLFISDGRRPMDRSCCSRTLKTIAKRAGLSDERVAKISNHVTRSTFGTNLANSGMDMQTIATAMRHSNIQTTFNSYVTMDENKIKQAFA